MNRLYTISAIAVFVFYFMCLPLAGYGQGRLRDMNLMAEGRVNYGFFLQHHLAMEYFNAHFPSFELALTKSTYGLQRWEAEYNFPEVGLTYWYSGMGNQKGLGSAHAAFPFINFPLVSGRQFGLNFRVGAGLVYLTKKFDRLENYKQIAIGSHINSAENLMLEMRYKPTNDLQFSLGAQLMHFSNGSIRTPNLGMNIISASGGAVYRLNRENPRMLRVMRPQLYSFEMDGRKFFELKLGSTFGTKQVGEADEQRFFIGAGFGTVLTSINHKNKLGLSYDVSYDGSDRVVIADNQRKTGEPVQDYSDLQIVKTGVSLAHELVMDRMSFAFNLGYYVRGLAPEGSAYYKVGIHYLLSENLFANLTLKTHYARADYVGIGLGYRLRVKHYLF